MKFYIAAADQEWARKARAQLHKIGHEVIARWIDDPLFGTDAGRSEEHKAEYAGKDEEDVRACDVLLCHNDLANPGLGGRHTEVGIAIGMHKPVHLIGRKSNIFHWNKHVTHWPSLYAFYAHLQRKDEPVCMRDGQVCSCRTGKPIAGQVEQEVVSEKAASMLGFLTKSDMQAAVRKPLVIGFAGVPSCGKTTLARLVAGHSKEHGFQTEIVPEYAREYIERFGRIEEAWEQLVVFLAQNRRENEVLATTKRDLVIIETPGIIGYAYARLLAAAGDEKGRNVLGTLGELIATGNHPDMVFYLPPQDAGSFFKDGVRDADAQRLTEIDKTIRACLDLTYPNYTVLTSGREEQMRIVLATVKRRLRNRPIAEGSGERGLEAAGATCS